MHRDEANRFLFAAGGETSCALPADPELLPPFDILEPAQISSPLIFSSPHSGSIYPSRFLASVKLDALALRRSEDAFVDELFSGALAFGAPLIRARFPRAYIDVNREPYELDPRMFDGRLPAFANTRSMRVAGGLGTIARVVGEAQEIYARRLPVDEAIRRIEVLYKPYHQGLYRLVQRALRLYGVAILIDCHSMPSAPAGSAAAADRAATRRGGVLSNQTDDRHSADFVIGDRFGTSSDPLFVDTVDYELRRLGYVVRHNKPYAGGFITEHYGNPAAGSHALQIEINRALYMDEKTLQRTAGFAKLAADLATVTEALVAAAGHSGQRAAAE